MIISIRIKATRGKGSFIYVQTFNAKKKLVGQFTVSFTQTSPLLSASLCLILIIYSTICSGKMP